MYVVFENDHIYEFIGSDSAKIHFLQTYPLKAHFGEKYSIFHNAGIFQLQDGPPILVLPWFLKEKDELSEKKSIPVKSENFFEVIREIKILLNSKVDLEMDNHAELGGLDLIAYSFLLNLKSISNDLLQFNYHEEVTETANTIKGKWNVAKDILRNPRPTKFTCTYGSLEKDIAFFQFVKAACISLRELLKSKKNIFLIEEVLAILSDVTSMKLTHGLLLEAKFWIKSHKRNLELKGLIQFLEGLFFDRNIYSIDSGLCYQFSMDKFFEELVFSFFQLAPNLTVVKQSREDLLGGSVWKGDELSESFQNLSVKASQVTIPDIVAFNSTDYFVFECKYKPLRIPFINFNDRDQKLDSFSRNDRNQLLSFIMSLRPSPDLRNRKVKFAVIFPSSHIETYKVSQLCFESAKLHIDPVVRNIIQNRIKLDESNSLTIHFIAINISFVLNEMANGNNAFVNDLLNSLNGNQVPQVSLKEDFHTTIQKRVALASLIIDSSKNERTLGRVKLAKIFYLADAHLKLGMKANYIREAAGPLDQRLLYNEKWGIEAVGRREAVFIQTSYKNDKYSGNRYTRGKNFEASIERAKFIFTDKIENIRNIILLLSVLDTESSEIVATLYACWNDLINKNSSVSHSEIIEDFFSRWHLSKKRFDRGTVQDQLTWMISNKLVPDGSGPLTLPKPEKIPSNF